MTPAFVARVSVALAACLSSPAPAETLKVNGSTTVNVVATEAAEALRRERRLDIHVDTQGGSAGGIAGVGDGRIHIGMSSRPLNPADRARYPKVDFRETRIGEDAVALIVSRDVWEGGVRALSQAQMRDIYEGRASNWKHLGGPDRRIAFFNKEPGRGTWEVFAHWLYGDAKKAPSVSFPEVGANEETRNKVAATRGALSQLSSSWADGQRVFALAVVGPGGPITPTVENIASGAYPMSRSLFLVTDGEPRGDVRVFVDYVLGEAGQRLVRKHGYLGLDQLRARAAAK